MNRTVNSQLYMLGYCLMPMSEIRGLKSTNWITKLHQRYSLSHYSKAVRHWWGDNFSRNFEKNWLIADPSCLNNYRHSSDSSVTFPILVWIVVQSWFLFGVHTLDLLNRTIQNDPLQEPSVTVLLLNIKNVLLYLFRVVLFENCIINYTKYLSVKHDTMCTRYVYVTVFARALVLLHYVW